MWQERAELARKETAELRELMERREALYRGSRDIDVVGRGGQLSSGAPAAAATVVRNIVAECVESLVDSSIPQPKVTARRKEDEPWPRWWRTSCAPSSTGCPLSSSTTSTSAPRPSREGTFSMWSGAATAAPTGSSA